MSCDGYELFVELCDWRWKLCT